MTWRSLGNRTPVSALRGRLPRAYWSDEAQRWSRGGFGNFTNPLRSAFYLAAANQLPPRERPEFQERVAAILRANPDPGPARSTRRYAQSCTGCRWHRRLRRGRALSRGGRARQGDDSYCGHGVDTKARVISQQAPASRKPLYILVNLVGAQGLEPWTR